MNAASEREAAVFKAACRLPAGQRGAYLDDACTGDALLRQRVVELLEAHAAGSAEQPGDRIGRYKLLENLGEGGCGVVYVAEQSEPVRRRVALKVIKLGMDTKQVVARFEAERQALAMMEHPNIAKVFDGGATGTGRPYFVMELVRGIRITDYCDQNRLATQERLDLFIQVCQAIQHAHQKGVIHRDIKPSNILVTVIDGVAVPKVIDFGIAKATAGWLTDKTIYTQLHQLLGTPAYMSPEQAEMSGVDIDTRSDIYSLGVLLYELLAGRTPFDSKELLASGLDAMRRTIREREPMRPSTRFTTLVGEELTATARRRSAEPRDVARQLEGDLDWIVMRCLEKDRARRYMTASGLAMDVQRHLNSEPVVASPPSNLYRFQKMARRHKRAFVVVAFCTLALLAATGVSLWAARVAKQRLAESEALSSFFREVLRGLEGAETGQSMSEEEALGAAVRKLRAKGTIHTIPKDIFDPLKALVKKLETDSTIAPGRRAGLRYQVADTYFTLGLYEEALPLRRQVWEYCLASYGPKDPITVDALRHLAETCCAAGRGNEAIDLMAKSCELSPRASVCFLYLAAWEAWFGRDAEYEVTRRQLLAREDPPDAGWDEQRAKAACLRPSTNAALLAKALDLARRSVRREDRGSRWLPWHRLALGMAEYRNEQYEAAEQTLAAAEHPRVGFAHMKSYDTSAAGSLRPASLFRAMSLFRLGKVDQAQQLFQQIEAQMPPLPRDDRSPFADGTPFSNELIGDWLAYKEAKAVLSGSAAKP